MKARPPSPLLQVARNTAKLNSRLTRSDDGRFAAEPRSWDLRRQTEGTAQKLKLVLCQRAFLQAEVHVQGANIEAQRNTHRRRNYRRVRKRSDSQPTAPTQRRCLPYPCDGKL